MREKERERLCALLLHRCVCALCVLLVNYIMCVALEYKSQHISDDRKH